MIKHEKPESRWAVKGGILAGDSTDPCCDCFALVDTSQDCFCAQMSHLLAQPCKALDVCAFAQDWFLMCHHAKHQGPLHRGKAASLHVLMQCLAIMKVTFSSAADLQGRYAEASLGASMHDCGLHKAWHV